MPDGVGARAKGPRLPDWATRFFPWGSGGVKLSGTGVKTDLYQELDLLVQELRRKVGSVWPAERAELRMHGELPEDNRILQGLEKLPIQLFSKVDIAFDPVCKSEVDDVLSNVVCLLNSWYHPVTPEGQSCRAVCLPECASSSRAVPLGVDLSLTDNASISDGTHRRPLHAAR